MKPSFRENAWGPLTFRPEEGSSCEEARWVGANSLAADRRRPRAHCPAVSGKVADSVKHSSVQHPLGADQTVRRPKSSAGVVFR